MATRHPCSLHQANKTTPNPKLAASTSVRHDERTTRRQQWASSRISIGLEIALLVCITYILPLDHRTPSQLRGVLDRHSETPFLTPGQTFDQRTRHRLPERFEARMLMVFSEKAPFPCTLVVADSLITILRYHIVWSRFANHRIRPDRPRAPIY